MASEPKVPNASVVDLTLLSANFPNAPQPELQRDNVVKTLGHLLSGQASVVTIEGPEGIGKTTVLSQLARAHPNTALSVNAANRLSFDPDLVRLDLLNQAYWILKAEVLPPGPYDPSLLKSCYADLQREARKRQATYFFIIDGIEDLTASHRDPLLALLPELVPFGAPQFRFGWVFT
jgi:AAA ATPase domain